MREREREKKREIRCSEIEREKENYRVMSSCLESERGKVDDEKPKGEVLEEE